MAIYRCLLSFDHGLVVSLVSGFQMQGQISGSPTILDLASLPVARVEAEFTMNIAPHSSTSPPATRKLKNFQEELFTLSRTVLGSIKLSAMLSVQMLVEDWLLDIVLRYELNEHSNN